MKYSSELFIKNIEYLVKYGGEPEEAQELPCAFLLYVTPLQRNANPLVFPTDQNGYTASILTP